MIKLFKTTNNGGWGFTRRDDNTPARWIKKGCDIWFLDSGYDDKDQIKAAGFSFDWNKKRWFAYEKPTASKLAEYAVDLTVRDDLMGLKIHQTTSLASSRAATTNRILLHPEGEEYMPFQCAGIEYMLRTLGD